MKGFRNFAMCTAHTQLNVLLHVHSYDSYYCIGKNELTGRIPDEIGRLSNATEIYLQFNELSGMIPTAMNQLTGLRSLYLNDNAMLTGSLEGLCSSVTSPLTAGSDCLDGMVQCSCCDNC